ncbi:Uncharacterised protein [Mycobacterium tuberculosis]|nr:Uncharacterised protein [Mycobacterium tuberculosis]
MQIVLDEDAQGHRIDHQVVRHQYQQTDIGIRGTEQHRAKQIALFEVETGQGFIQHGPDRLQRLIDRCRQLY